MFSPVQIHELQLTSLPRWFVSVHLRSEAAHLLHPLAGKKWKFSWAAKEMVFYFIRQKFPNVIFPFRHFCLFSYFCFVLFSFLTVSKTFSHLCKWKWQKKGENVWKGNPWVLLSDKAREGEAGTSVLHIKILSFNKHKRWSYKDPVCLCFKEESWFFFSLPKLWLKYMGCCFPEKENTKIFFFTTERETEKWSQAGCGLSGAAVRALSIAGSLGNTSLVPKLESLWDPSSGHAHAF